MNNKTLKLLQSVLPTRNTLPVLHNALVKGGKFEVTDIDLALSVNHSLNLKEGLYELKNTKDVSLLPQVFNPTMETQDFPLFNSTFDVEATLSGNSLFVEKLEKSLHAHSKEESRYYLKGSYLDVTAGFIVATDGHRLFKAPVAIQSAKQGLKGAIIPTKACKILVECFKLFGEFELHVSASKIHAFNQHFSFCSKTIDGTFPDYNRVIPEGTDYKPLNWEPLKKIVKSWNFADKGKQVILKDGAVFNSLNVEIGKFDYPFEWNASFNGNYILQIPSGKNKNDNMLVSQERENGTLKLVQGSDIYVLMPMRV